MVMKDTYIKRNKIQHRIDWFQIGTENSVWCKEELFKFGHYLFHDYWEISNNLNVAERF